MRHKKQMYTSYFAKVMRENLDIERNCFAISRGYANGFRGIHYRHLAPSEGLLSLHRNVKGFEGARFVEAYKRETLSRLNPLEIYDHLGNGAILVCWEGPRKFCHRHIVADWLMENINGLKVSELW